MQFCFANRGVLWSIFWHNKEVWRRWEAPSSFIHEFPKLLCFAMTRRSWVSVVTLWCISCINFSINLNDITVTVWLWYCGPGMSVVWPVISHPDVKSTLDHSVLITDQSSVVHVTMKYIPTYRDNLTWNVHVPYSDPCFSSLNSHFPAPPPSTTPPSPLLAIREQCPPWTAAAAI